MTYFDTEVTHDNAQMLPMMRLAIDASKEPSPGTKKPRGVPNGVNILASPWSPPPWMKVPVAGVQNMSGQTESVLVHAYNFDVYLIEVFAYSALLNLLLLRPHSLYIVPFFAFFLLINSRHYLD